MSSIKVSWQEIQSAADGCDSQRKELADYISSLRGVKAYRAISGGAYASIYKTLDKIIDGLEAEKKSLRNLSSGLAAVKETYMEAENKLRETFLPLRRRRPGPKTIRLKLPGLTCGACSQKAESWERAGQSWAAWSQGTGQLILSWISSAIKSMRLVMPRRPSKKGRRQNG